MVAFSAAAASPLLLSFVQGRLRNETGGGIGGADRAEGGDDHLGVVGEVFFTGGLVLFYDVPLRFEFLIMLFQHLGCEKKAL